MKCVTINFQLGDLGNIKAMNNGRSEFQMRSSKVKVWDVIGRSFVIHKSVRDDILADRWVY